MDYNQAYNMLKGCHIVEATPSVEEINKAILVILKEVQKLKKNEDLIV